ncbi:conserved exported hypothetical protein [Frankia canadensis]|uniref:Uncharacterized protein n=1 Tax=Frankia canadensis TaxID=1836972 RepID=A0A2I2KYU8_9ACTN|nr:conserved exported hypothetical protein [Frankia canadensis]SOU58119.1 conserved exported hypothetical protein [Frankia canadensis]
MPMYLDLGRRNKSWKRGGGWPVIARLMTIGAVLAGALVVSGGTASAATLTDVAWSVDNNVTGATGVTYTWSFTTLTAGTIASVTFTVPAGTTGTPTVTNVFGLGAGTVALASDTVTYTVTTPAAVPVGTPIFVQFGGFTNTTTPSPPPVTSTVETRAAGPATIDTGTSGNVNFGDSNTAVTILLGRSLIFTNDTPAFTLQPVPGTPAGPVAAKTVTLTVQTNAGNGYTLAAALAPNPTFVAEESTAGSATLTVNKFAAQATLTPSSSSGAALSTPYTSSKYVGYDPTTPQTIVTATAGTNGGLDTLALNNQIKVDFSQPSGAFHGIITYTVTPSYT